MTLRTLGTNTAALNNAFARRWAASTAYTTGDRVVSPNTGLAVIARSSHTSDVSYSATNWKPADGVYRTAEYGGVLDGSADDATAFQAAVTAACANAGALEVSGRIRITTPAVLPSGAKLTMRAAKRDSNAFGVITGSVASIETGSGCTAVFTAADTSAVTVRIDGVNFRNTDGSVTVSLFDTVTLSGLITDCTANGFNYIFKGGTVPDLTDNRFVGIKTTFSTGSVTDVKIRHNYINGSLSTNSTVFTGVWAHSLFEGNFVDFFKRVFDLPNGNHEDVRVIGNVFDYIWCTVGTSGTAFLTGFTIVGNAWNHCTAAVANLQYTAEDADMTGTSYRAVDASSGMNRSTITGNSFIAVDLAIRLRGACSTIKEGQNTFNSTTVTARIDYQQSWSGSNTDVILETLERNIQTLTFAAAQTVSFASAAVAQVTLTANMTNLTPSNPGPGMLYELHLIQDGTGSRLLSGSSAKFKWAGGTVPTLSTGANKRDIFRFRYDIASDNWHEITRSMNVG